jgi:hypothetical protein
MKGKLQGSLKQRIKRKIENGRGKTRIETGRRKETRNEKGLIEDSLRMALATNLYYPKKSITCPNQYQSLIFQTVNSAPQVIDFYRKMQVHSSRNSLCTGTCVTFGSIMFAVSHAPCKQQDGSWSLCSQ